MHIATINGCRVQAGDEESLKDIFRRFASSVSAHEPGCRMIKLHRDADDPLHFLIYSEFDSEAAYQAHLASGHVASLREELHRIIGDTHHKTLLHPMD